MPSTRKTKRTPGRRLSRLERVVLGLAADVIEEAHGYGRDRWGVTPFADGTFRINVGWTELLTTEPDHLRLIVHAAPRNVVRQGAGVRLVVGNTDKGFYPSLRGSVLLEIPFEPIAEFESLIASVRPSLSQAIRLLARRPAGDGVQAGHRQSTVEAIAILIRRKLPEPSYAARRR